jgi:hypothetical protein
MAWSEAAREASIEARRASAKTKAMPSVKSHPDGREGKIRDHKAARDAHLKAADLNEKEGNDTGAQHHYKMAELHSEKAGAHEEKNTLGLQRQTLKVQQQERVEAKIAAQTPGRGKTADERHVADQVKQKQDAKDKAASTTKNANKMSEEATTFRDGASHARASAAHREAASANKVVGDKANTKYHERMVEKHEALEKSYKGGVTVERGRHPNEETDEERNQSNVNSREAAARGNPSQGMSSGNPGAKGTVGESKIDAQIASGNARMATEKARSSGTAEAHDAAAEAHFNARNEHDLHQDNRMRDSGARSHEVNSSASQHHQKMAEHHMQKAQKIRDDADKKASDERARNAPRGVGKYWNS